MVKYTVEDIKMMLIEIKSDFYLLTKEYKNNKTKMKFKCKKCDATHTKTWATIREYPKCNKCAELEYDLYEIERIHPYYKVLSKRCTYAEEFVKVWCKEHKIEFEAKYINLKYGKSCPKCKEHIHRFSRLKEHNTINAKSPHVVKYLKNKEDAFLYTYNTNKKVQTICPICGTEKDMSVSKLTERGHSCPKCSKGISTPEKYARVFLNKVGIDFEAQKIFNWAKDKRYDFYIPSLNAIIEVHGMSHYKDGCYGKKGNDSVNDEIKKELAIKNGISMYVEVDCRYSEPLWLKNNFYDAFKDIFNLKNVDFNSLYFEAIEFSAIGLTLKEWNMGNKNARIIAEKLGMGRNTISRYLGYLDSIGIITYNRQVAEENRMDKGYIPVDCYDKDMNFIKTYPSISHVGKELGLSDTSQISKVCRGKAKSAYGFIFKYSSPNN